MSLTAPTQSNSSANKVPQKNIEPGSYPARVVQIIDFGLQPQRPYKGQDKPPANEIGFTYELVDEFMKDEDGNDITDKPRWISEVFPLRALDQDKAKSTERYKALDPEMEHQGDFSQLIVKPCIVLVVNNTSGEKTYDNVSGVSSMRPRDAINCPELKNPSKVFDLSNPNLEIFNSFPKWIQEKITSNLNFKGSPLDKLLGGKPSKEPEKAPEKKEDNNNPY